MLRFTDLSDVIEAVRIWCDTQEAGLEFAYYGYIPGEWQISISTPISVEEIVHSDLCHALMAASIAAKRKLNTGT
ncbi:hypothetical protein [Limnoglobus roseus]|uniref:Phage ABA sandwich domain-containing protein n=1 Tax=Limnoglobus roseus TaxID=2598579 RepID=A0A5C1AA85_9BACT|nr:hypothetical protein [Limnoglobus roseus]QEL14732.1 hypothetical protein PX52LOC_01626 [Limnoglobus roseus]